VVGLAMMVGCVVAGFLIERLPTRAVLGAAVIAYVLAGTAGLYLSSLPHLLASRLVLGFSAAIIQITSFTLINTRLDGAVRAHWMGMHIFAAMVCTIAVHPIAGLMGDHSWRWPFALHALGLMMIPAVLVCRDRSGVAAAVPGDEGRPGWAAFLRAFPFHYLPLAILIGSIVFLPAIYAPFLLRDKGMGDPSMIALVLTADSIAGAIASSQYGRARRYVTRHGAFLLSFGVAATGTLIAGLSPGVAGIAAGMVFYGFGTGWFVPNLMTSVGEKMAPAAQARAVGLVKAAHFSSTGLALLVMEPITRNLGSQGGLLVISGLAAILASGAAVRIMTLRPARSSLPA
jgi:MFS family permease